MDAVVRDVEELADIIRTESTSNIRRSRLVQPRGTDARTGLLPAMRCSSPAGIVDGAVAGLEDSKAVGVDCLKLG